MTHSRSIIVGTAGHVDHGKTSLIKALTGIDTDRLAEEKKRGITIDLGFAHLRLPLSDGGMIPVSFVDVPGHKSFLHNMLAGVGGIELVLLVVSAEEGVKPQTREHLNICTLLGIKRGMTVITKCDAIDFQRLRTVRADIERFLEDTFLCAAKMPIIEASVITGQGLSLIKKVLSEMGEQSSIRDSNGMLRLPIDRHFAMRGFGTVVTGTLVSGTVRTGQTLIALPEKLPVRVRGLEVHSKEAREAGAGTRVALNLQGIDRSQVRRGSVLVEEDGLTAVDEIDVELVLLKDIPVLKHRSKVHFHCYSAETVATVILYGARTIEPGGSAVARLRLDDPIQLCVHDKFVVRQFSPVTTIGGGRILDVHPLERVRKVEVLKFLQAVPGELGSEEELIARVERRGYAGLTLAKASVEMAVPRARIEAIAATLAIENRLIRVSDRLLLSPESYRSAWQLVERQIHRPDNERQSSGELKKSELFSRTDLPEDVFNKVLMDLVKVGKAEVRGDLVSVPGAKAELSDIEQRRLETIKAAFRSAGLAGKTIPNVLQELRMDERDSRKLITLLLREKVLIPIRYDMYLHFEAVQSLLVEMAKLKHTTLDVAKFKQITGLSRKHAIPLLEYLDLRGVTRRSGEERTVL